MPAVARMAAGDERALGELIRRHGPRLHALARRFCGNAAGADDIVQETFWAAWRSASRWTPGEIAFKAYLTRIAVNRAIDGERRLRLRRFFGLEAAADVVEPAPSPRARWRRGIELAAVVRDIDALPARQRAAILLSAGGERTKRGNRRCARAFGGCGGAASREGAANAADAAHGTGSARRSRNEPAGIRSGARPPWRRSFAVARRAGGGGGRLVATDGDAARRLAEARRLDDLLAATVRPAAIEAALVGRIVAGEQGEGAASGLQLRPTPRLAAIASLAMAAALIVGFTAGHLAVPDDGEACDRRAGLRGNRRGHRRLAMSIAALRHRPARRPGSVARGELRGHRLRRLAGGRIPPDRNPADRRRSG